MTDRIDFGSEPWQAIPRRVLRDSKLSARAKGGLVTLLSHEEGWVRSCIAILQHECAIGRKQAQAIMAELRDLGYAELVHERDTESNLVKTHYVVRAMPESAGSQPDLSSAPTYRFPTRHVSDPALTGSAVVEALDVEALDVNPSSKSKSAPSASDNRPSPDQFYLAEKISQSWGKRLGMAAIQKLNTAYGRQTVENAMRELHGFPPEEAIRSPFAYLEAICTQEVSA